MAELGIRGGLRIHWETVQVRVLSSAPLKIKRSLTPRKDVRRPFSFLRLGESINPNFKPYRTGILTVKEKYSCGSGDRHKGRNHVYYLCQCDCGKEVIFSGEEIARHPYSCGCAPKPIKETTLNKACRGQVDGTLLCMISHHRRVYSSSSTGISGVCYDKKRKKWRARIVLKGREHFLGYFDAVEEAIKARLEGEKKYWEPLLEKREPIEDNKDKEKPDKEAKK